MIKFSLRKSGYLKKSSYISIANHNRSSNFGICNIQKPGERMEVRTVKRWLAEVETIMD